MKSVMGKTVLITGAAMGMGRLFAERAIAERAAAVILWDVAAEALAATTKELGKGDVEVTSDVVDVRSLEAIRAAGERVRGDHGDVEVLFNNAGVVRGNRYFWETDPERDTEFTVAVNTLAPMFVAHEFLPGMVDSRSECRLVNLASAAGFTANPRMAAYAGSKWAVIGWSDSMRLELAQADAKHVKVTTVCPYYVKTGMFDGAKSAPLLPLLEPQDVVDESWKGMLNGDAFVVMPKTVVLSEMMKGFIPTDIKDFIADRIIGVYHTMEDFKGRAEQQA